MPAPTFSQQTPAPDSTDADIDLVSIVWQAVEPETDPLDISEFTISCDSVQFPIDVLALGGGAFRVSADVGLFPDDTDVEITATAETVGGQSNSAIWNFDCRTSGFVSQIGDFHYQAGLNNRAVAELPNVNPEIAGAAAFGDLTPWPAWGFDTLTEFRLVEFVGAMDIAPGRITVARQFVIIGGIFTLGAGVEQEFISVGAFTSDQGAIFNPADNIFYATQGQRRFPVGNGIGAGRFDVVQPGAMSGLVTGRERFDGLNEAVESVQGSGVDTLFSVTDPVLDALSDE